MGHKLAIDFGTTNTVAARWDEAAAAARLIDIPGASNPSSIVPSLLYVEDGQSGQASLGQVARDADLVRRKGHRLFRNFKRGIVAPPSPDARLIDGALWTDHDAGRVFLRRLIAALPYPVADIDQLVLTAPVASFESYLVWLNEAIDAVAPEKIRIVDESTAAALGYAVTEPDAAVLVIDFGGGTLDVSLVQLPESRETTGGFLDRLRGAGHRSRNARVVAKSGRAIGGSDIDRWLMIDLLQRAGLAPDAPGLDAAALLAACEQAKIELSSVEETGVSFEAAGRRHAARITRAELEALLTGRGFFAALSHVVDRTMHAAQRRGVFKEDIAAALLVGGVSLMPSVFGALRRYFGDATLRADKPFTAVAEGALQIALGRGVDDYLAHGLGLRHLDPDGRHRYEEVIPMGSRFPTETPVEIVLGASRDGQTAVEFVVGEIGADDVSRVDVRREGGQAVFVAQVDAPRIAPLDGAALLAVPLDPPGQPGDDRLKAMFRIDDQRRLRVTVIDLKTRRELARDAVLATIR